MPIASRAAMPIFFADDAESIATSAILYKERMMWERLWRSAHLFAFAAYLVDIDTYYRRAGKRCTGVFLACFLKFGGEFGDEKAERVHSLLFRQTDVGCAFNNDAFVFGGELLREQINPTYYAKTHFWIFLDGSKFSALGSTMHVYRRFSVPHMVDGNAIRLAVAAA